MQPAEQSAPLRHAVALGVLHGPAELLPISSSAHTTLLPWLLGWPYARLDGQQRKAFEVALHAGAGAALAIHLRRELAGELAGLDAQRLVVIALALAPPALAGYVLERPIAKRLGGPRSIAAGLAAGAVAMALADRRRGAGADGGPRGQRDARDARAIDGLALGLAQAAALIPGVSRNGATLTAARARGFSRAAAQAHSWHAALPVIAGASVLEGARTRRAGVTREERLTQLTGAVSAFASTLAVARLLRRQLRDGRPLWPYALYRALLAALVVARSSAE